VPPSGISCVLSGPSGISCVLSPLLSVASGTSKIYRSLLLAVSSSTIREPSGYMILKIPPFAITASLLNTLKALSLQLVTNGLKAPSFRVSQKCLAVRPKSGLAASDAWKSLISIIDCDDSLV
jgi:hypothetical protein